MKKAVASAAAFFIAASEQGAAAHRAALATAIFHIFDFGITPS
jgi:hypothetical protein